MHVPRSVMERCVSHQQNSVQAAVHLWVVGHLRPPSPHDLPSCGDHTELADVDFDDSAFGEDTQLGIHGILGVLRPKLVNYNIPSGGIGEVNTFLTEIIGNCTVTFNSGCVT